MNLASALQRLWYGPRWASLPLWPLAWLFRAVVAVRRGLYRAVRAAGRARGRARGRRRQPDRGGTGKTPVAAWLAGSSACAGTTWASCCAVTGVDRLPGPAW